MNEKQLVNEERQRQINEEGYSIENDKIKYPDRELAEAAQYALFTLGIGEDRDIPPGWDAYFERFKKKSRLRKFVIAGALFKAQIDVDDRITYDWTLGQIYNKIDRILKECHE